MGFDCVYLCRFGEWAMGRGLVMKSIIFLLCMHFSCYVGSLKRCLASLILYHDLIFHIRASNNIISFSFSLTFSKPPSCIQNITYFIKYISTSPSILVSYFTTIINLFEFYFVEFLISTKNYIFS